MAGTPVTNPDYEEGGKGKTSTSKLDGTEILRNIADQVDQEGNRSYGILELLTMIQADVRYQGIFPLKTLARQSTAAAARFPLISCPAKSRIVVFDMFATLNAAGTLSFVDQNNVRVLSDFIAAAAGISFSRTSYRGLNLGAGNSLFYTIGAITHSLDISYAIIPA